MPTRVKTGTGSGNPTHYISLSDGRRRFGLTLDHGPRSIQQTPITPSTVLVNQQGSKFGDYDPSMSHLEQRSWIGGRGGEDFGTDNTKYFDGKSLWTYTDEYAFPAPQWKIATGFRNANQSLPGSMAFRSLIGTYRYISISFVPSATYSADVAYLWIRRRGSPGTLTLTLNSNSSGDPGTVLKTVTASTTDITDTISVWKKMDWTSTQSVTSGTTYHLVISGASTDNAANHWEVGVDESGSSSKFSTAGSTWSAADFSMYYRVTDADIPRRFAFFAYEGTWYAYDRKDDGTTATQLWSINSSGVATEITGHGLGVVTDIALGDRVMYFAQGDSVNMRRWNGTSWADDGTNKAKYLWAFHHLTEGGKIYRSLSRNRVSKADTEDWGTRLTFDTAKKIGTSGYQIMGFCDYNNQFYIFKEDSIWYLTRQGIPTKLNVALDDSPSDFNGAASTTAGLFLYFSFLHSVERLYGNTLDDVGPSRGAGIPSGRQGVVGDMDSAINLIFMAINAGTSGYSSVMMFDGVGYHEIFRADNISDRVRVVKWQPGTNTTRPKLWVDCGNDIYYLTFPLQTFNPLRDSGMTYMHEAVLVTATFDMTASRLPKLFAEVITITRNLGSARRIEVDYQYDDDIASNNWIPLGAMLTSPESALTVNEGNRHSIRFRFRMLTSAVATPPVLKGTVIEGFARTPVKYQYVIRAKLSTLQTTQTGAPDHNPDKFLAWMKDCANRAELVYMRSSLRHMDYKPVIIEPPTPFVDFLNSVLKLWGGSMIIVCRDA